MRKNLVILATILLLPLGAFAQDKFGFINSQELMALMPERATIEQQTEELAKQYEEEMLKMREEYYGKIKEFQEKQATMPESIKEARQTEIMDLEQRIQAIQQTAYADIQKKQEAWIAPVRDKIMKAIDQVGAENGFTYIFDMAAQSIIYKSSTAVDVLPLVKKKLAL